MRGLSRLRRLRKKVRAWWRHRRGLAGKGAVILCYHRVAHLPESPRRLWVSPERFAEHLDYLVRSCHPISLADLVQGLQNGRVPDKSIVVTFDDGYADNLWNAKPLLERYGVPATVFVTSGFVGQGRWFYWDELACLLLEANEGIPHMLTLALPDGQQHRFPLATWQQRLQTYYALHDRLRPLPHSERDQVLEQVRHQLGDLTEAQREKHRALHPEELLELVQGGLVEVGAHTVHHPDLPCLPEAAQWQEIGESKQQLEAMLDRPVRFFAYPYGNGSDQTRKLVRQAGFVAACALLEGTANNFSNLFWLPRLFVENWDGDGLARQLWETW
ncbi:MAG: polysaccharide deacetylase family protein [Candidatus Fervidibacter sp.]|uniref:polysaccharide deacetylase family protein n=1 Tax=Candidatus Fervidibacter sp. TaxID=3100871 RepID=UPI0040497878